MRTLRARARVEGSGFGSAQTSSSSAAPSGFGNTDASPDNARQARIIASGESGMREKSAGSETDLPCLLQSRGKNAMSIWRSTPKGGPFDNHSAWSGGAAQLALASRALRRDRHPRPSRPPTCCACQACIAVAVRCSVRNASNARYGGRAHRSTCSRTSTLAASRLWTWSGSNASRGRLA